MWPDALWKKLKDPYVRHRILVERLGEPLHLNVLSAFVAVFGSTRAKIDFDLVLRPQHAASILRAADIAKSQGLGAITVLEFGVASGAGLLNMCRVAELVTAETGIRIDIAGFDTGAGMPTATDYRDHPELYREGDYPMIDPDALARALPSHARLLVGNLDQTIPAFLETVTAAAPIGFVSIDVDYYSSTVQALRLCAAPDPTKFLPITLVYLDDVTKAEHNPWCGELLAVNEFNSAHALRKIAALSFLKMGRIFQRAIWLNQMYILHVLDHPLRHEVKRGEGPRAVLANAYLPASAAGARARW
jgi:hypothetical protein